MNRLEIGWVSQIDGCVVCCRSCRAGMLCMELLHLISDAVFKCCILRGAGEA